MYPNSLLNPWILSGQRDKTMGSSSPTDPLRRAPNFLGLDLGGPRSLDEDEQMRLQRELDWCVEQLELGLRTQKSTPKQAEQAARAVKTLRSNRAELPKKRQVMRSLFGDYRARMEEDRKAALKAMEVAARSARVLPVEEAVRRKSSRICRHRGGGGMISISSPKEEFRFNFF
ncbi:UPF0488 protein C8orf33 homolog isoform X2 [Monodelphis domestica]|uniref:UPF0488 protein C8orf33 homolog isoform X2 n=1 Tax=Monodelphis domestica TaxID=13616 RepID=UPI0007B40102|nr:UPF0488 protein C8orf33 homolog isoform X2 [Monodelphis domestica]